MSSLKPLNYAAPPLNRRKIFRQIILPALIFSIALSSSWWAPIASKRVQLLYWQHRCLRYAALPNQVVFDSSASTQSVPVEWTRFYTLLSPPGSRSVSTLLLHEMKTPRGEPRLVSVELFYLPEDQVCYTHVFRPAGPFSRAIERMSADEDLGAPRSVKYFAGIVDTGDPSHFSFRVIEDGKEVIHDGWLQDNNTVKFDQHRSTTMPMR